jgi:uncharacterized tellurite resistance protein B-like protein
MSFLRKMFGGGLDASDPRRFVVEAMLAAMEADGDVTAEEMEVFQKNLAEHELFADLSSEATSRLIDMAADAIREAGGGDKRIPSIAKGMPGRSHRLTAYALACEVCVSDAELPEAEIRYLERLQHGLQIDEAEAREIFEAAREQSGLRTLEEKTSKMRELMPRFVDCMALMAASDGEVHEEELAGVRAVLRNIPDMAVLTSDELEQAIAASFERVEGSDPAAQLEGIAEVIGSPNDRYWTTVYMMIIALSDGKTDWREVGFLKTVETIFGLTDAQMDQAMSTASMFPAAERGGAAPA